MSMTDRLSDRLKFTYPDHTFYEDANALWTMIKDHYNVATAFRMAHIMVELSNLRYNGNHDPKLFIAKYQALHTKGKLLCPSFPFYNDEARAVDVLSKMPQSMLFDHMRSHFYNQEGSAAQLSVRNVENYLKDWWINSVGKHKATGEKTYTTPTIMDDGQRRGRSRDRYNTRTSSMSRERIVSANPTFTSSSRANQHDRSTRSYSRDRRDHQSPGRKRSISTSSNHDMEGEGTETYICPTLVDYENSNSDGSERESFAGSAVDDVADGNRNYHPTVDEVILDSGSAAMITPREEQLENIHSSSKMAIQTISGRTYSNSEGTMTIGRLQFKHMKIVRNAPFTILSVGQICNGKQLIAVCTEKCAYLIPKVLIDETMLIAKAIMTFPKRGNLYVKSPHFNKGDRQEVKVISKEAMAKFEANANSKNKNRSRENSEDRKDRKNKDDEIDGPIRYANPNELPKIPKKGKHSVSDIKAASDDLKGRGNLPPPSLSASQPIISNPVITRSQRSRTSSPHPRSRRDSQHHHNVQFHDKDEEYRDNSENYEFRTNTDGSSDSDEY
jgi:hypothetical protein